MKRQKGGKRGIENNVNTVNGKRLNKPLNREKNIIESNVNTVQGRKHWQYQRLLIMVIPYLN